MSAQRNIWDYYSICKKKLDRLHARKLRKSLNKNEEDLKSTLKHNNNDKKLLLLGLNEQNKSPRNLNLIKQPKIGIDNETRQIILKSNTIIDQAKSPIKRPDYDDFLFKKPTSPAPRAKRRLNLDQATLNDTNLNLQEDPQVSLENRDFKRSNNSILLVTKQKILNDQVNNENLIKLTNHLTESNENLTESNENSNKSPNDCKIRKRLFDFNLNDLKTKVTTKSTNEFLNKLKDFQEKSSFSNTRFNISFYSPTKRAREQLKQNEEKRKDLTNYSPKKYLESRLLNSPSKSQFVSSNSPLKSPMGNSRNLPGKYLELLKIFYYLELAVLNLFNGSEICTFDKVKLEILKLMKGNPIDIELTHLAQILFIYPGVYSLDYDNEKNSNKDDYNLKIKPNIQSDKLTNSPEYNMKIRVIKFKYGLLRFAKQVHDEYLVNLKKSNLDIQDSRSWHPDFKFPNIPKAKLPEPPASKENLIEPLFESGNSDEEIEVIFSDEE